MRRRDFLNLAGEAGLFFFLSSSGVSCMNDLYYRIRNKIKGLRKSPVKIPPESERRVTDLPREAETIPVETALNSRCNSDYDGDQAHFHWGLFDKDARLTQEQIARVVGSVRIPRFTDHRVEVQADGNILTFLIEDGIQGIQREWAMMESGMQHQATGLICAALGVGVVFQGIGDEGTAISDSDYGSVRIKLDAMKPSYGGSFWSSLPPKGSKSGGPGSLADPDRRGRVPLLTAIREARPENSRGKEATDGSLSQLLWAARGRTPHLYKSRPWGMTIAVSRGDQNISSVYVIRDNGLSKYVNWEKNGPAHSLERVKELDSGYLQEIRKSFSPGNKLILLAKNEPSQRANWEIGYQLLNLILQAHSLGIAYKSFLLNETSRKMLARTGVGNPAAVFSV